MKQIGEYLDKRYTTVSRMIKRFERCDTERPDPALDMSGVTRKDLTPRWILDLAICQIRSEQYTTY